MVTNKSLTALENSQMALTLTVDAASIEEAYKAKINKYAKEIQMKGFRKGKAPISVIESKFGSAIREESTFDLMESSLKETIETLDEKDKPLQFSTPVLQNEESLLPFKKDSDITFTVHYDVKPSFDLPQYTGLEVKYNTTEVADSDVDAEIEKLREQNAVVLTKDAKVANGDIVTCNYVELDSEGNEVPGTSRKDFTFTVGSSYNFYGFDEDIIGMAKGEEKKFEKTYAEDYANPDYKGKTITLIVNVTEVKERQLPEVDDEFAQDVKEEYKTVEDMKNGIKANLQKEVDEMVDNVKKEAIVNALNEATTLTIPASMIEFELESSWRDYVRQTGLTEDQILNYFKQSGMSKESFIEGWREPATKNLKNQLILEAIQKKENFEVDEKALEEELNKNIKEDTDEATKDYYRNVLRDNMQYAKVLPFLLEKNTFTVEKVLPRAEFLASINRY
ncbi:MAG: trigger factor [Spirochaetales bacterium]|uniref:trigger factor n=1 Tax=Bullifex sp. TaxID=2815808 RepID=UPI002A58F848|nr:trigger factor [Bullifex sp.]MDD5973680.1 trigger factor [Spirochaetales bacterium]MDD7271364.1 trigger factor [Spirochaetales bacterium]MDY4067133.1 trigger factor [Bullifex sp.]